MKRDIGADPELLHREAAALRQRVLELEAALQAIGSDEVDALMLPGANGLRLFTLTGADRAYRTLIEGMHDGALTLTGAGIVAYANRRVADLTGRPLREVVGAPVALCFAPECQVRLKANLADHRWAPDGQELDLLTVGGERVPVMVATSRLAIDGVPDAMCMIITDLRAQRRSDADIRARQALMCVVEEQRQTASQLQASLDMLRLRDNALAAISQGVLIADSDGNTTYVNGAFEAITGYSAADLLGRSCSILQGPETSSSTVQTMRRAMTARQPFHAEMLNYRKDGTSFWNELTVTPVLDAQGQLVQFVGVQRDVTERREADAQRLLSSQVFEQGNEGIIITDAHGHIVKVNAAFTAISGFSEEEVLGQNPRMFSSGRQDADFYRRMWGEIRRNGRWAGEVWNRRKDGSVYPEWLSISRAVDDAGQVTNYIASFSDITQRKANEDRIRQMAHYDALTGLPNRVLLHDRATQAIQSSHRSGQTMALVFIDLDHFKHVNDSLGHPVGDRLLKLLASRLKSALREQDTLSRVGGDEFVVVLPETDANGAAHVANKVLQLALAPLQVDQHELTVTWSMGIAIYPFDGADFDALSKCADTAMYRAKRDGRNAYCFYTTEMQAASARVLMLENALRRALDRGELQLHYQPQCSLHSGQIIGAEALLRWQHPELGWVSPAEFIPIAESCGLIHPIGEWVMRTALQQLRAWLDRGMHPLTMAVNLSAVQFRRPDLPDMVVQILAQAGVDAQCLELELTESVASHDPLAAVAVMNRLRQRGVQIAIDDFGTGYSSLSYLKRFQVSRLKIDQSFVQNLVETAQDQAIVTAIIHIAASLGLRTVAEGVETPAQLEWLRQSGCDEMQGYLFSRPLPADRFEAFVHERQHTKARAGLPKEVSVTD
jgi:diguanylate cyclase (GGDEF)-like protein/PAS domain S-box-containing protein